MGKRFASVFFASVAAIGLLSCGGGASTTGTASPGAPTPITINLGHTPSLLYLPFYVAEEKGYFSKRGITISKTVTPTPVTPLIAGDVDIAMAVLDNAIISANVSKPTPAVVALQQRNSLTLVARADLSLPHKSAGWPAVMKDLPKGAVISVPSRTGAGGLFLKAVIEGAGLRDGVDYSSTVIGSGAEEVAALKAKRVDVALLFPPFDSQAIAGGFGRELISEAKGQGPPEIVALYGAMVLVNSQFLKAHPAAVHDLVAAIVDAQRFVRDVAKNRSELISIAQKVTGITDTATVSASLDDVAALSEPTVDCKRVSSQVQLLLSLKTITTSPSCGDVVALDFVPKKD